MLIKVVNRTFDCSMPSKKNIYLLCSIYVQPSQVFCYVWWKWWSSTLSLQSTHRKIWLTMECMFDMKCKMSFLTFQAISKSFWSQIDFILSKWAISKLTWAKWVNFEPNGLTLNQMANFEPNGPTLSQIGQLWAKWVKLVRNWTRSEPNCFTLSHSLHWSFIYMIFISEPLMHTLLSNQWQKEHFCIETKEGRTDCNKGLLSSKALQYTMNRHKMSIQHREN